MDRKAIEELHLFDEQNNPLKGWCMICDDYSIGNRCGNCGALLEPSKPRTDEEMQARRLKIILLSIAQVEVKQKQFDNEEDEDEE
jgi:hypothetical protein